MNSILMFLDFYEFFPYIIREFSKITKSFFLGIVQDFILKSRIFKKVEKLVFLAKIPIEKYLKMLFFMIFMLAC